MLTPPNGPQGSNGFNRNNDSTSWFSNCKETIESAWVNMKEDIPPGGGVENEDEGSFFDGDLLSVLVCSGAFFLGGKMIGQFILFVGKK